MKLLSIGWNPWFSLGIHIDHVAPHVVLHLPLAVIRIGRENPETWAATSIGSGRGQISILARTPTPEWDSRARRALREEFGIVED